MYNVVKLACLSAALAAALMAVAEPRGTASPEGRFLADHARRHDGSDRPLSSDTRDHSRRGGQSCAAGWPYRGACSIGTELRLPVRIIDADSAQPASTIVALSDERGGSAPESGRVRRFETNGRHLR